MDYNENGQISDEELEEKIEQEISAQRERIAMEVWEELKKEDPDMPSYIEENYKIWKEIDLENISKNISKLATKSQDGSDFCAEIFAGQMFNKSFSDEYIELAQKLNAPLIERDAQ